MSLLKEVKKVLTPEGVPMVQMLNPWHLDEDGVVFMHRDGVEVGLRYHLPEESGVTTDRLARVREMYTGIIQGCGIERARLSFVTWHREAAPDEVMEMRFPPTADPLQAALALEERQANALRATRGDIKVHDNLLFVFVPDGRTGVSRSDKRMWSEQDHERIVRQALTERDRIISALRGEDILAYPVTGDEPFELLWRYYNHAQARDSPPVFQPEDVVPDVTLEELRNNDALRPVTLRSQVYTTEILAQNNEYLENGGKKLLVVDMINYGRRIFAGLSDRINMQLSNYHYLQVIHVQLAPEGQIKARVERNINASEITARDTNRREDRARAGALENEVMSAYYSGGRFVRMGMSYIVGCNNDAEVRKIRELLRNNWHNVYGHQLSSGNYSNWHQFMYRLAPYSGETTDFLHDIQAQYAAEFMPFYGPWHNIGGLTLGLFQNAYGGQQRLTLPKQGEGGAHMAVIGSTRSGKSFTVQKLLMNMYMQGAILRIMDMKDDYRPLVEWLGGQFIPCYAGARFSDGRPVTYNVFEPRAQRLDDLDKRDIVAFLKALIHYPLSQTQDTVLRAAVEKYASAGDNERDGVYDGGSLGGFVRFLHGLNRVGDLGMTDMPDVIAQVRELALTLSNFTVGSYGQLFDGEGTIDLRARVIAFDMSQIGNDPHIMGAVAVMLQQVVWREAKARSDKSSRIVFVSEETGISGSIPEVKEMLRTSILAGAAYNIMNIIIAQNYEHIEALGDVLNNISRIIMGRASSTEANLIGRLLEFNEEQVDTLASLQRVPGQYNDLLVREQKPDRPTEMGVIRYAPSALEFALFSSDPDDKTRRDRILRECGGNMHEAVRRLTAAYA